MTDADRAEEYRKSLKQKLIDEDEFERLEMFDENVEEAYLAGLKAARKEMWHDLRKNPNDLPLVHSTILDENGDKVEYIGYGEWQAYSEYYEKYIKVDTPIVWCEIPTFEE